MTSAMIKNNAQGIKGLNNINILMNAYVNHLIKDEVRKDVKVLKYTKCSKCYTFMV